MVSIEGAAGAYVDLVPQQPAVLTVTPSSLEGIVEELATYHAAFAPCFHYQAPSAARQVVHGMRCRDAELVEVDHVEVGLVAGHQPPAIAQAHHARRHVGEPHHRGRRPHSRRGRGRRSLGSRDCQKPGARRALSVK